MSPSERKSMINHEGTDLSLTKQCKLLKLSRSSLYCTPVSVNAETLKLMNEIDRVFTKYPFFGSRQIAAYLPRNGFHAGRHRVRRLMGIMGLQAIYKGPNISKKHSIPSRTRDQILDQLLQYRATSHCSRQANPRRRILRHRTNPTSGMKLNRLHLS